MGSRNDPMGKLDLMRGVNVRIVKWYVQWIGTFWRFTYNKRIVWISLLPPWVIRVTLKG